LRLFNNRVCIIYVEADDVVATRPNAVRGRQIRWCSLNASPCLRSHRCPFMCLAKSMAVSTRAAQRPGPGGDRVTGHGRNTNLAGGVLLAPGAAMAQGREAIADSWRSTMMELKNFHLEFAPTKIEVASSGDLAYEMRFILWLRTRG
jgi:hypothetical protein